MKAILFRKSSPLRTDRNDPRGATSKSTLGDKDLALVEIRRGALRGGHYHDIETLHIVLKGRISCELNPMTNKQGEAIVGPMGVLQIPAGIAHLAEGLEDSIFIELLDVGNTTNEPQRERIRRLLKRVLVTLREICLV